MGWGGAIGGGGGGVGGENNDFYFPSPFLMKEGDEARSLPMVPHWFHTQFHNFGGRGGGEGGEGQKSASFVLLTHPRSRNNSAEGRKKAMEGVCGGMLGVKITFLSQLGGGERGGESWHGGGGGETWPCRCCPPPPPLLSPAAPHHLGGVWGDFCPPAPAVSCAAPGRARRSCVRPAEAAALDED